MKITALITASAIITAMTCSTVYAENTPPEDSRFEIVKSYGLGNDKNEMKNDLPENYDKDKVYITSVYCGKISYVHDVPDCYAKKSTAVIKDEEWLRRLREWYAGFDPTDGPDCSDWNWAPDAMGYIYFTDEQGKQVMVRTAGWDSIDMGAYYKVDNEKCPINPIFNEYKEYLDELDEEAAKKYDIGDVNFDGRRDVRDLSKIAAHIAGEKQLYKLSRKKADINGDGKVNAADIVRLASHIRGTKQIVPMVSDELADAKKQIDSYIASSGYSKYV